ncbi:hypothetical protein AURDEDRAFT_131796 [Auricularia subglabra TFB-10046 SS5]|uniref:Uncharacterized protein n=1 Tax=Auricularia subglabra (strain TFB-10046 / SS5) TaxID=717982 RepID=J0WN14_AURST|nr:hypothetical protein AURDEDRAFT_131796 [Auricularia subglabra TFB-10046 SS5]
MIHPRDILTTQATPDPNLNIPFAFNEPQLSAVSVRRLSQQNIAPNTSQINPIPALPLTLPQQPQFMILYPAIQGVDPNTQRPIPIRTIHCYGGCQKSYTRREGREKHWRSYPECEARHANYVRGTELQADYVTTLRNREQQEKNRQKRLKQRGSGFHTYSHVG